MKNAATVSIILISVWAVLALLQLWIELLPVEVFFKLSITFLIVGSVAVGVSLIRKEYIDEQQMKRDKFID
jgi:hypothetical protein